MPIDNLRDSHSRREFTRVFRALERCRDTRDEMKLHCLSAANPFFFRVARVGQRHEDEEKFFRVPACADSKTMAATFRRASVMRIVLRDTRPTADKTAHGA
jgi:hypothetical protein